MSTCFGSLQSGHVHKRRSSFTETQKSIDFMNISPSELFLKVLHRFTRASVFTKDAILSEAIPSHRSYI